MHEEEAKQSSTTTPPPSILKKLADQVDQIPFGNLLGDSSFNFGRFDILWASNRHFYQKLQPFETYGST